MKVSEFYQILPSVSRLISSTEISAVVAFRLRKFSKEFNDELRTLEEQRNKLIKQLGIQSKETGEYTVDPTKLDEFKEAWEAVQQEDVSLPEVKITLKESEPAKLSALDHGNLEFMIEEGTPEKPK